MRLPPQPGERLDRTRPLTFSFEGEPVHAYEGDTIGSALFAGGRRVFSRSFKYHRPRGLLCCTGSCPNCLMQVDGVPNVCVCTEPARGGANVRAQNVLGSLDRDEAALVDSDRARGCDHLDPELAQASQIRSQALVDQHDLLAGRGGVPGRRDPGAAAANHQDLRPAMLGVEAPGTARVTVEPPEPG